MRNSAFIGLACGMLVAAPAYAAAQQSRTHQSMTRGEVQARVQANFARMDANRDGFVSKAEAEAQRAARQAEREGKRGERRDARFAALDADRNGAISRAEFDARQAPRANEDKPAGGKRMGQRGMRGHRGGMMTGGFGAKMFERADADKDGRISLAEASARSLAMFDRSDANKDGTVTAEERRAAMKAFRADRQSKRAS